MNSETMTAGSLTVGCQVAERDGYLLTVRSIVRETPKTITLDLYSPFSPMLHTSGIEVTMRKSSRVVGFGREPPRHSPLATPANIDACVDPPSTARDRTRCARSSASPERRGDATLRGGARRAEHRRWRELQLLPVVASAKGRRLRMRNWLALRAPRRRPTWGQAAGCVGDAVATNDEKRRCPVRARGAW